MNAQSSTQEQETNKSTTELTKSSSTPKLAKPFKYRTDCRENLLKTTYCKCPKIPKFITPKLKNEKEQSDWSPKYPKKIDLQDEVNLTLAGLTDRLNVTDKRNILSAVSSLAVGAGKLPPLKQRSAQAQSLPSSAEPQKAGRNRGAGITYTEMASSQVGIVRKYGESSTLWAMGGLTEKMASKDRLNQAARQNLYKTRWSSNITMLGYNPHKVYDYGEEGSGLGYTGRQNFYLFRDHYLQNRQLFVDDKFPTSFESLNGDQKRKKLPVVAWRRPFDLCNSPKLFVKDLNRFDVRQGLLGDCWFLASLANITLQPRLLAQVIPLDQSFDEKYAGIFHFRFWQFGRWVDICVDDYLPIQSSGKLAFLSSKDSNEFWPCLVEKAYAKLYGSYVSIESGSAMESMSDLTGGICESFTSDNRPKNLFDILLRSHESNSILSLSIAADANVFEAALPCGLIRGHSYTVSGVAVMAGVKLIRLRNPWGQKEWKGAFCDYSQDWNRVSKEEKERYHVTFEDNGEFWIPFSECEHLIDFFDFCHLQPDVFANSDNMWKVSFGEGQWVPGITAGGCFKHDSFSNNPQFFVNIRSKDKCTMIVNLHQKGTRRGRHLGPKEQSIGIIVYLVRNAGSVQKPLSQQWFKQNKYVGSIPAFEYLREMTVRYTVFPGVYCIVPSTYKPNEAAAFFMRIYTDVDHTLEKHDNNYNNIRRAARSSPHPQAYEFKGRNRATKAAVGEDDGEEKSKETKHRKDQIELLRASFDNDELISLFQLLQDEGEEIDWNGVQQLLKWSFREFPQYAVVGKDTCRSMLAFFDRSQTGKLVFQEFKEMWIKILSWAGTYFKHYKIKMQALGGFALRTALEEIGLKVNSNLLNLIMHRYGKSGYLSLDAFCAAIVKLTRATDTFKEFSEGKDTAKIEINNFLEVLMIS